MHLRIKTVLILCLASTILLMIFWYNQTVNGVKQHENLLKLRDEQLCESTHDMDALLERGECPRNKIVTVLQGGRLGNQMYEYAAVYAVARQTRLAPYVPRCIRDELEKGFENLSVPSLEQIAHCPVVEDTFVKLEDWKSYMNQSILLRRYCQYSSRVLTWIKDIRKEFTFKKIIQDQTQRILQSYVKNNTSHTFIGVHVRRTDYHRVLSQYKASAAEPAFYFRAMDYFESRYENSIFVIASDDPEWCQDTFSAKSNAFVGSKNNSAILDLAILSACNHSIFDYGTYGIWAALLAGGETVYLNSSSFGSRIVADRLDNWHGMN